MLGVEPDERIAWLWYRLAAQAGDGNAPARDAEVASQMSAEQRAEAEAMLADWEPGDCAGG